ncbi:MAG: hypothetical protein K0Q69_1508 [Devosia sp.]|nr:hypothetical protein [Devosia sp.]
MTSTRALSLAFLPLDERPVNIGLPAGVAAIAGATLVLPPAELLPRLRQPGDADGLGRWLESTAPTTDAVIASLDMLCYGGLIAARTTADPTLSALTRLDLLRRLHAAHPALPLCAVSLVMRASNSYNPQEEPDYWAQHGMELHKLGALPCAPRSPATSSPISNAGGCATTTSISKPSRSLPKASSIHC